MIDSKICNFFPSVYCYVDLSVRFKIATHDTFKSMILEKEKKNKRK